MVREAKLPKREHPCPHCLTKFRSPSTRDVRAPGVTGERAGKGLLGLMVTGCPALARAPFSSDPMMGRMPRSFLATAPCGAGSWSEPSCDTAAEPCVRCSSINFVLSLPSF